MFIKEKLFMKKDVRRTQCVPMHDKEKYAKKWQKTMFMLTAQHYMCNTAQDYFVRIFFQWLMQYDLDIFTINAHTQLAHCTLYLMFDHHCVCLLNYIFYFVMLRCSNYTRSSSSTRNYYFFKVAFLSIANLYLLNLSTDSCIKISYQVLLLA